MAKGDAKGTQQQENQSQTDQTAQSNAMITANTEKGNTLFNQGTQNINQAAGYYGDLASSGGASGINQSIVNQMQGLGGSGGGSGASGGGGGGNSGNGQFQLRNFAQADPYNKALASTGGVDMGALTSTVKDYQDFAANPVDAGRQATVEGDLGNLRSLGTDANTQNNFMGNGVYKDLSTTGGYNDAQKSDFMQRATSTVPAMYQQMADEMARRRAVQGGYAPGFDKSNALLARQGSQAMTDATRNASVDLNSQINSNKLAGAQGLTQGQSGLSNLQLSGTNAAQQGEQSLQDLINRYKMQGLGAETAEQQQAQQIAQQGKIAGAGFLTTEGSKLTDQDIASSQAAAAASMANAQIAAANQRYVLGLQNSSQMTGIGGLQSTGGQFLSGGLGYDQLAGTNLGQQLGYTTGMYGAKNGTNAQITSGWNTAANMMGGLGGIMPSFGGGGGGFGSNNGGQSSGGGYGGGGYGNTGPGYQGTGTPGFPGDGYSDTNNPYPPGYNPANPGYPGADPGQDVQSYKNLSYPQSSMFGRSLY